MNLQELYEREAALAQELREVRQSIAEAESQKGHSVNGVSVGDWALEKYGGRPFEVTRVYRDGGIGLKRLTCYGWNGIGRTSSDAYDIYPHGDAKVQGRIDDLGGLDTPHHEPEAFNIEDFVKEV